MKNIETLSLSLSQRESLLLQNEDLLYGVYEVMTQDTESISLRLVPDVLSCYENKITSGGITGLSQNSKVSILDLKSLMSAEIKTLSGPKYSSEKRLVLLSNGVIEYIESENKDGQKRKHLITTLRDGGAAASLKRTTTAGRNTGWNLQEEALREHIEEAPFLGKNTNGEYVLCTTSTKEEHLEILKKSISRFLLEKYTLDKEKSDDKKMIQAFERNFGGIKYSELRDILGDIVKNNRFMSYTSEKGEIEGLSDDMKQVSVQTEEGGKTKQSSGEFFVFFDEKNNTFEYRTVQKIVKFPDDFKPITKRPSRLYLESQNQYPRIPRIDNAGKGAVPTIEYISNKVKETL